jgi:hypothetical protein
MTRALLILASEAEKIKAIGWIKKAPWNTRVEFKAARRSPDQNSLMWCLLTELAEQLRWHNLKLSAEDYKDLLSAGLRREVRTVPNITGDGFVLLGMRTSDMGRDEMSQMIELCYAFGARHGVTFREPETVG